MKNRSIIILTALACALLFATASRGANVYGNIQDVFGTPTGTRAIFTPKAQVFSGGKLTASIPRPVDIKNGFLGASNLVANYYTIDIGAPNKPLTIAVPNDVGDFTLEYCAQLATNKTTFIYNPTPIDTNSVLQVLSTPYLLYRDSGTGGPLLFRDGSTTGNLLFR